MSDYNEITAVITTEEPAVAATLDELRYLVFEGKKGDTGDSAYAEAVKLGFVGTEEEWIASLKGEKGDPGEDGVSFVHAYLDEGVVRYVYAYKEHEPDDIYTSTAMAQDIENGILPLLHYSPEDDVFDYFELDRYDLSHASRVVYFRSKDHLLSVDSAGAYTLTDRPQGGGSAANAVLYTPQTLTAAQQAQARTNVGAGTYSKPSGGIPASDLAQAVQTSLGKADTALQTAPVTSVNNKTGAVTLTASDVGALPSSTSIPTAVSELTNDSGYQTAQQVQTAIAGVRQLPTVSASDNGKFLRVVSGAWAAETVSTWQGGSY